MLREITVEGFKTLENCSVELGTVNVFIGANGAGKSNLLEAIGVLGAAVGGRVDDAALLGRGVRPGLPALYKTSIRNHPIRRFITLTALWSKDGKETSYKVSLDNPIEKPQPAWAFRTEALRADSKQLITRSPRGGKVQGVEGIRVKEFKTDQGVAALFAGHAILEGLPHDFLAELAKYAIFSPTTSVLRSIAPDSVPRQPVGLYGGNLAQAVSQLLVQARGQIWEESLLEAMGLLDWIKKVEASSPSQTPLSPSVPTTKSIIRFTDRYMKEGRNILSGYDASEGALYCLYMLVLAAHPDSPRIFAVDNFDQALNPRLAREMAKIFCRLVKKTGRQVFLTTHNPLVLDGLDLKDPEVRLFTVSRNLDGQTLILPVKLDLEALKSENMTISRLWVSGRLGGVPDF